MPNQLNLSRRLIITVAFTTIYLIFLLWEHMNNGVATHYLLFLEDSPGLSNWWGLVTIPILVYWTLIRIQKVGDRRITSENKIDYRKVIMRFFAAFAFGALLSYFFEIESAYLGYLILVPFVIAIFLPIYFLELLLGFVVGTVATLGVIIPMLFGLILLLLYWIIFRLARGVVKLVS